MKEKLINSFKIYMCLTLAVLFAFGFSGCLFGGPKLTHPRDYYGEREVGDFLVYFFSNDTCTVKGTTEQGNSKRFLVIPQQIEDSPVDTFGNQLVLETTAPLIESKVLEKVFVESEEMIFWNYSFKLDCPTFKKIICLKECAHNKTIGDIVVYFPRYICERYSLENPNTIPLNAANVSYYYNYEDAENYGYYWADDCDYGGKIEFIPEEPVREGYEFGGWYKEAECINEWDFEVDTLPEEVTEPNQTIVNDEIILTEKVVYQETILYAKWINAVKG